MKLSFHIYTLSRIIYLHRKTMKNVSQDGNHTEKMEKIRVQKEEMLSDMIQTEAIEIVVPLGYMSTFLLGYYGPNYEIIGNMGSSYWHFQRIDDVLVLFEGAMQFLAIDIVGTIISILSFWVFCNINVIRLYCSMIKKSWLIMAMKLMFLLNQVGWQQKQRATCISY